jgi:hypothetical protein
MYDPLLQHPVLFALQHIVDLSQQAEPQVACIFEHAAALAPGESDRGRRQGAAEESKSLPPGHRRGEDTGNVIDELVHVFGPENARYARKRWPDYSTRPGLLTQP